MKRKMKKNIIWMVVSLILAAGAVYFVWYQMEHSGGDVSYMSTSFTSTEYHNETDIKEAMRIAKAYFKKEFADCKMTALWYDDAKSVEAEAGWIEQYHGTEAIVLLSTFDTGKNPDEGLNPNDTYTNWQWILVKNTDGKWNLETWGY